MLKPKSPSYSQFLCLTIHCPHAPPSLFAYSSSMFSSYNLSAALLASDAVCDPPAFASSAAEPPLDVLALSMAEETWLVDVSLVDGLSLVRDGREGIVSMVGGM